MHRKLIGQSMIEAKLISQGQLHNLLLHQKMEREKIPLGRLSIELGYVKEENFAPFLASYFDVPYMELERYPIAQKEAIELVPQQVAKRYNVLPIIKEADILTVATSDPIDLTTLENLKTLTHCHIKPVVSASSQIRHWIAIVYNNKKAPEPNGHA